MINLNPREKILIKILTLIVGVLFIYFAIISPVAGLMSGVDREYESNLTRFADLDKVYAQYSEISQAKARFESMVKNEKKISSAIEENAAALNILKNMKATHNPDTAQGKYKKHYSEVRFEGIDIKSVLDFLYRIENSNLLVIVSNLRISHALKGRYDVTIAFEGLSE